MPSQRTSGRSALESLLRRYESTETKCPDCGYIDERGNWTSQTDGQHVVYLHVCPGCGASREHTFDLGR